MKNLKQLIKSLKLDYVNSDITEENFPEEQKRGKISKIFQFNESKTSEEILKEMDKEGYRPATLYELLERSWDGKEIIVALGSVWQIRVGDRDVPYLYRDGSGRELGLGWGDSRWRGGCRFAAVRKSETSETLDSWIPKFLDSLEIKIGNKEYKIIEKEEPISQP